MKIDKVVKPEKKVEFKPGKVVLELTYVEAVVLLSICHTTVTGRDGNASARGATSEIGTKLRDAGVPLVAMFDGTINATPSLPLDKLLALLATGEVA